MRTGLLCRVSFLGVRIPGSGLCSGSEEGSYLRIIDFAYHSTLGLRVANKTKKGSGFTCSFPRAMWLTIKLRERTRGGVGLRVEGFVFGSLVSCFVPRGWCFGFRVLGVGISGLVFRVPGSGFTCSFTRRARIQGS